MQFPNFYFIKYFSAVQGLKCEVNHYLFPLHQKKCCSGKVMLLRYFLTQSARFEIHSTGKKISSQDHFKEYPGKSMDCIGSCLCCLGKIKRLQLYWAGNPGFLWLRVIHDYKSPFLIFVSLPLRKIQLPFISNQPNNGKVQSILLLHKCDFTVITFNTCIWSNGHKL